jgi:hypothetical protein
MQQATACVYAMPCSPDMQEQECSGNLSFFPVRTYLFFEHTAKVTVSSSKAWHEPDSSSIAVYSLSDQPLVLHCIACMCAQQPCITVAVSAQWMRSVAALQ